MTGTNPQSPSRRTLVAPTLTDRRAQPEVYREDGRIIVTLFHPESDLKEFRYETHRWSLRIWKEGQDLMAQHQVVFPAPVDPKTFVLRLENGVLEFIFAEQEG